jgi:hypothetical protein
LKVPIRISRGGRRRIRGKRGWTAGKRLQEGMRGGAETAPESSQEGLGWVRNSNLDKNTVLVF